MQQGCINFLIEFVTTCSGKNKARKSNAFPGCETDYTIKKIYHKDKNEDTKCRSQAKLRASERIMYVVYREGSRFELTVIKGNYCNSLHASLLHRATRAAQRHHGTLKERKQVLFQSLHQTLFLLLLAMQSIFKTKPALQFYV